MARQLATFGLHPIWPVIVTLITLNGIFISFSRNSLLLTNHYRDLFPEITREMMTRVVPEEDIKYKNK